MKKGQKHGHGLYSYPDGSEYDGEFVDGKHEGHGTYKWASGRLAGTEYTGEWQDGKRHGKGVHTWTGGSLDRGTWERGKKHGAGTYFDHKTGKLFTAEWDTDKIVPGSMDKGVPQLAHMAEL